MENTRPIILLPSVRKLLSKIVINRIYDKVAQFIPTNQAAYQKGRSTTKIIWAHKLNIENCLLDNQKQTITGIDLSGAFDTIVRERLLTVLLDILEESEVKIIAFLLDEMRLKVRNKNEFGEEFLTNVGSPQGDSLSPILFIIYLEAALKSCRNHFPRTTLELSKMLKDNLSQWGLILNEAKTEIVELDNTSSVNKLGTYLDTNRDLKKRKQLEMCAMNKLNRIWNSDIKIDTKIRVYNVYVKSIFLYGCTSWCSNKSTSDFIDIFQRNICRKIHKIFWPNRMSNEECESVMGRLSKDVRYRRLLMIGKILHSTSPAEVFLRKGVLKKRKRSRPTSNLTNMYENRYHNLIAAGDFNAQIGRIRSPASGSHAKGCRNSNGEKLLETMATQSMYVTNTTFKHPARHKTTWSGYFGRYVIYNVIDYIFIKNKMKRFVIDSRSYLGTQVDPDHRLVITKLLYTTLYQQWTSSRNNGIKSQGHKKLDYTNETCKLHYKRNMEVECQKSNDLNGLLKGIKIISNQCFEKVKTRSKKTNKYNDDYLKELCTIRMNLRKQILSDSSSRRKSLIAQRKTLSSLISERCKYLHEVDIKKKLVKLEKLDQNNLMFEAVKELRLESKNPIILKTEDLTKHFSKKLTSNVAQIMNRHRHLPFKEITINEVNFALKRSKSSSSPGTDNVTMEELIMLGYKAKISLTEKNK